MKYSQKFEIQENIVLNSDEGCINKYKLISSSIYFGSGKSGHYIAYCRAEDGEFYSFNDSSVDPISFNKIKNAIPYILFYEKVKTKEIEYKKIVKIVRNYLTDIFKNVNPKYHFEENYSGDIIIWEDISNCCKLTINFKDFLQNNEIIISNEENIISNEETNSNNPFHFIWKNNIEALKDEIEERTKTYCSKPCVCLSF
jgi:hypothetical protein